MLERVGLHHTRLHVPGLQLDARGVAWGRRGLLLLPTLDRLVALLALASREQPLPDLLPQLEIAVVVSKLGLRELVLSFEVDGPERLDRAARLAQLVNGFAFTGTSRHFVQVRDAASPLGYDAAEIIPGDAYAVLYHQSFTQAYELDRKLDVTRLLLGLALDRDPQRHDGDDELWILAEPGLGPALIAHLARAEVAGRAGLLLDDGSEQPGQRGWLLHVERLPRRLRSLCTATPGLTAFRPAAPGVVVEHGYVHPVNLSAWPSLARSGLVLLRGSGQPPLRLTELPALAEWRAFLRFGIEEALAEPELLSVVQPSDELRVRLQLVPTGASTGLATACWIAPDELPLLRKLAYVLPPTSLSRLRVALTELGAWVYSEAGIDPVPLGQRYRRVADHLFIPAGHQLSPAVTESTLQRALRLRPTEFVFVRASEGPVSIPAAGFVALSELLLAPEDWLALSPVRIVEGRAEQPSVWYEPLGPLPMAAADREP